MNIVKKTFSLYKEAYTGLPREAWLLALVEFINRSGSMVFFYMTLYLTQTFGYSVSQAGQVLSAFGLGGLIGAYLGGKLTDTIGAYAVQKLSLGINGVIYLLLGRLTTLEAIMGAMFLLGISSEALHPANSTALSQVCSEELRTKGFALNRLAINLGVAIGPLVGGYLAMVDYSWLFWLDGITCLLAAGVFLIFLKGSRPPSAAPKETPLDKPPKTSVIKDVYFLKVLVLVFFSGLMFMQLFTTFPLYMKSVYFFKENSIGLLIAINTILIVMFEMLLMEVLKKKSLVKVIAVGCFLLCGGFALMPFGTGFLYAAFTVAVWTLGEMLAIPSMTTLVANHSDDSVRGKYMGFFSFAFALAVLVGPALGTFLYDTLGADNLWYGCGLLGSFLFLGFFTLEEKRELPGA